MSCRVRAAGIAVGISLLWASLACASPDGLKVVGSGEMRWLMFNLYEATLYSQDGRYQPRRFPLALTLIYARAISRQSLIEATRDEWQRLALATEQEQARWLPHLATIWPDVRPGDRLTLYVDEQGRSRFMLGANPLGEIADPAFADAFLAIWLDRRSRDPALGRRLRGEWKE